MLVTVINKNNGQQAYKIQINSLSTEDNRCGSIMHHNSGLHFL